MRRFKFIALLHANVNSNYNILAKRLKQTWIWRSCAYRESRVIHVSKRDKCTTQRVRIRIPVAIYCLEQVLGNRLQCKQGKYTAQYELVLIQLKNVVGNA